MHDYVEFFLACDLKADTPIHIMELLTYLIRENGDSDWSSAWHSSSYDMDIFNELDWIGGYFFDVESEFYQDWRDIFQPPTRIENFRYFSGSGFCKLELNDPNKYSFTIRCEVLSTQWFKIRHLAFLELLAHYVKQGTKETFIGYFREAEKNPVALYVLKDTLTFRDFVEGVNNPLTYILASERRSMNFLEKPLLILKDNNE